jgi:hypothetical protein
LAAIVLGANPFRGQTVAPLDLLVSYPGWSSVVSNVQVLDPERSDILDGRLPTWTAYKKRFWNGKSLLWNSTRSGGVPGIQDLANGAFTPAFLAFLLIKNNALGYYVGNLLNLVIAGLGMYLFLRLFISPICAFFGGIVYMLAGFNAAWFFWPHVATDIWIPWLLWTTTGWLRKQDYRWLIGISFSGALLIGGGFPSVGAYGFYAFSLWVVFFAIERWWSQKAVNIALITWPFLAVAFSFIIMALPLFSLARYLGHFDLSYRTGGTALSSVKYLWSLINPYFMGLPRVETTGYIGVVALALSAIGIGASALTKDAGKRKLGLYAGLLFIISITLAFGWINHDIIRLIPGIGTSLWSRLLIIVDLSLAVLASIGLSAAVGWIRISNNWRIPLTAVIVCLIAYQVYDQKQLFNRFNAVVPSQWWYPWTPALAFVRNHLGSMQSVIADNSYLVSGTLTEYGIPQWYAHAFKTNREKSLLAKMVDNPFRTPTAAMFNGYDVNLKSPLMDLFDIKYVLMNVNDISRVGSHLVRSQPQLTHVPAPPLPANNLVQHIRIRRQLRISGISLVLATYGRSHAPSDVRLVLLDDDGHQIASSVVSKHRITDNSEVFFSFKNGKALNAGGYQLQLHLLSPSSGRSLTAWSTKSRKSANDLFVNGHDSHLSMLYKIWSGTEQTLPTGWSVSKREQNVVVLKNDKVPKGAYLVSSLNGAGTFVRAVHTRKIDGVEVVATVRPNTQGFVVFPMRSYPGWKAYINGHETPINGYLGVFPAVKVNGAAKIMLRYEPIKLVYVGFVSLGGLVGSIAIPFGLFIRRRNSSGLT